jgi:capsular exopolysaccharide synthesis family protein
MSRIQNILEKAEREGAVRRVRPQVEDTSATLVTVDGRATMTPPLASPSAFEAPEPVAPIAPPVPSVRVVTGTRLSPSLLAALSPSGTAAEQYRALRTRIVHSETGGPVNVVLITSPGRGDGKSLTAANLGLAMAQEYQQRICVVDADFRSPQQRRLFGLPETPGLADVLLCRATIEEAVIELEEHHISVLPAGSPSAHPAELFGTTTMRRTIETLRSRFDRIVIDSPAATPLADVGILAPLVDSVVLIVRAGYTSKPAIHDAIAAIDAAKLLGVVLNEAA